MTSLPWTPDFDVYQSDIGIREVSINKSSIVLAWEDGKQSEYNVFLLRENSPDEDVIHPKSRELLISPLDIPENLTAISASVRDDGALLIIWSSGDQSAYHPGWLREHAWYSNDENSPSLSSVGEIETWESSSFSEPPSFDGNKVLQEESALLQWLEALHRYGIARLRGLPCDQDDLLERIVRTIYEPSPVQFKPEELNHLPYIYYPSAVLDAPEEFLWCILY